MKIAVTAASGQLGSAVVDALKSIIGKDSIVGIVRTPEKAAHLDIEIRKADYNSREAYTEALKGIDKVLLISGMGDPQERIPQHRNVIEAAKANGVQKIVYTSIIGDEQQTAFNPIVKSNRQTEADVRASDLPFSIGRNGIYIEPDLDYIDTYVEEGGIRNCAGDGRCCYTSRPELGLAYSRMLLDDAHNGHTYNLVGEPITQSNLAELMNQVFGTALEYHPVSVQAYQDERKAALGDFLGTVIAGIYEGIRNGVNDVPSDFETAAGRLHKPALTMIQEYQMKNDI